MFLPTNSPSDLHDKISNCSENIKECTHLK